MTCPRVAARRQIQIRVFAEISPDSELPAETGTKNQAERRGGGSAIGRIADRKITLQDSITRTSSVTNAFSDLKKLWNFLVSLKQSLSRANVKKIRILMTKPKTKNRTFHSITMEIDMSTKNNEHFVKRSRIPQDSPFFLSSTTFA